jgi:hypothetical protein
LREAADTFGSKAFECGGVEGWRGIRALRLAVGVVGVGGKTETEAGVIALAAAIVELYETCGLSEEQNENAGGQRIECAEMADLAKAYEMTDGIHYVVRCFALRFVDDQGAVEG